MTSYLFPDFRKAGSDFTAGVGDQLREIDVAKYAKKAAEGTAEFAEDFLRKMGRGTGKGFSEGTQEFIRNMKMGEAGKGFGQEFNDFFANFKFAEGGRSFGNEFKQSFENTTRPMNEAFGDAFSDLGNKMSFSFVVSWAPTILGYVALLNAIPLTLQYIYEKMKYNIGRPKLAIKERTVSFYTPLVEKIRDQWNKVLNIFRRSQPLPPITPIFNSEISRQIADITKAIPNIWKNKGVFQNVILYGPGGTGKTMICEKMAKDANMNYVMMSGGDLAQYIKRGEHVTELNRLLDRAQNASLPTLLFIDEAESFAKDRSLIKKPELLELQNAFLNRTGTPENGRKMMIIMATNRIDDIDEAVLSRMDYKIEVGHPELAERVTILKMYVPHFFNETEIKQFFSDKKIEAIAAKVNGLSGRTIFKMLNAMVCKKACTANNQLTQNHVDQTLDDFVKQEGALTRRKEVARLTNPNMPKAAFGG